MFKRNAPLGCLAIAVLFIVGFGPATPPQQPETGPGGRGAYAHASFTGSSHGEGADAYWLFEPDEPKPHAAPVVVFVHGWGGTNPTTHGAWIEHLVRRGHTVIYPVYQKHLVTRSDEAYDHAIAAVGDSDAQKDMGQWSDGTPVKKPEVTVPKK